MIYSAVQTLIDYALKNELITADDIYVVRNRLMGALGLSDWEDVTADCSGKSIDEILLPLIEYACENGIIADTANSRDLFDTKLMGILTPMPREVVAEFRRRYADSPEKATDWYYDISKKLNYVRAGRIKRDLKWQYESEYGTLDITINCSKPEKDPPGHSGGKNSEGGIIPKVPALPRKRGLCRALITPCAAESSPDSYDG